MDQWVITAEERSKHDLLFLQQNPVGGYLSGQLSVCLTVVVKCHGGFSCGPRMNWLDSGCSSKFIFAALFLMDICAIVMLMGWWSNGF